MDKRDALAAAIEGKLNRHTDQALGASDRNGFDSDAGVETDLLLAALEHFLINELNDLRSLSGSLLPFDTGVDVLGVFAVDDEIHALGVLYGRRSAFVVLYRSHAGIEIERLAEGNVQRADASADGCGQRTLDGHAEFANGIDRVLGKPITEFGKSFLAGEDLIPGNAALPPVGFLDGGVEDADGGFPDVASGAIAFDKRNDWIIRDLIATIAIGDARAVGGHGKVVE